MKIGQKVKIINSSYIPTWARNQEGTVKLRYKDKSFLVKIGDQCLACVSEDVVIISYKCDCNVDVLMSQGCKCGGS